MRSQGDMTDPPASQRQAIRDQLIKEFNEPKKPKSQCKPPAVIQKKPSCKQKFLQNPNMRPHKGDVPDYMPAIKSDKRER